MFGWRVLPPSQNCYVAFWLKWQGSYSLRAPSTQTPGYICQGAARAGLLLKGRWGRSQGEALVARSQSYIARGEPDKSRDDGQVQPKIQVKMLYNGDGTGSEAKPQSQGKGLDPVPTRKAHSDKNQSMKLINQFRFCSTGFITRQEQGHGWTGDQHSSSMHQASNECPGLSLDRVPGPMGVSSRWGLSASLGL